MRKPKGKSGGRVMVEAIEETLEAAARGEPLTVRHVRLKVAPPECKDIRAVRETLQASQALFALYLGVPLTTLVSWECGRRNPSAMARRFLAEIQANPAYWRERLIEATHVRRSA